MRVIACIPMIGGILFSGPVLRAQPTPPRDSSGLEIHFRVARHPANGSAKRPATAAEFVVRTAGNQLRLDARRLRGDSAADIWVVRDGDGRAWQLFDRARKTVTPVTFAALMRQLTDDAESDLDVLQQEAELRDVGTSLPGAPTLAVRIRRSVAVQSSRSSERPAMRINSITDALIDTTRAAPAGLENALALLSGSLIDLVFAAGVGNVELKDGGRVPRGLVVQAVTFTEEELIGAEVTSGDDIRRVSWIDTVAVTSITSQRHGAKPFGAVPGFKRVSLAAAAQSRASWVPDALRAPPTAPVPRARSKRR